MRKSVKTNGGQFTYHSPCAYGSQPGWSRRGIELREEHHGYHHWVCASPMWVPQARSLRVVAFGWAFRKEWSLGPLEGARKDGEGVASLGRLEKESFELTGRYTQEVAGEMNRKNAIRGWLRFLKETRVKG